jgi:RNA polymerase sigma-70 factor, ECF subfamily
MVLDRETVSVVMPLVLMRLREGPRGMGDERALLTRIAEHRDREAFARLFDAFAPRVKSFMMRKGASSEQAEDLVQETMIAVWAKAAMYVAERGSVTTWIFTIARNLRIDRLRREKTSLFTDIDDYDAESSDPQQDDALGRLQEDGLVAKALAQIPEEQRQLLVLSYVEDLPQSEIAKRLQIPLGTVKSRMRLAYRRMRKLLETVT